MPSHGDQRRGRMYRNQDGDGGQGQAPAEDVVVAQAQAVDQADPTELQRAEADSPPSASPAPAPPVPAPPTVAGVAFAPASPVRPKRSRRCLGVAAVIRIAVGA